uniref:Uncharacterized protein n=1 Tax=Anguilla anguilla TaxID=7936 RepID=A0A0E9RLB1_ANGAN
MQYLSPSSLCVCACTCVCLSAAGPLLSPSTAVEP